MENKLPTAENLINKILQSAKVEIEDLKDVDPEGFSYLIEDVRNHVNTYVKAALEAAADKNLSFKSKTLQRQEILNAYPTTNIK